MPIKNPLLFTGGCLAGAVGMYYADPHRGAYRRAVLRDKSTHFRKVMVKKAEVAGRDLSHRTRGALSVARARIFTEAVADEVLLARVCSKIGRLVANPHALSVTADRGNIVLSGALFTDELEPLLHVIRKISGVRSVEKHLDPHGRSERFADLQSHRRVRAVIRNQTPALRLLIGLAGGIAALSGSFLATRKKSA